MKTIIEGLHEYFKNCPLMADGKLNVDFLPEKGREYSIDTIPAEDVLKRYVSGSEQCQYVFVIRTVTDYGQEILQNLDNSGFFENLAAWLRKQNKQRKLPMLPTGNTAEKIEAQSTAYLVNANVKTAKY
ncbi:MAG: hypothetical protein RSA41_07620 [Christensenella sp.]